MSLVWARLALIGDEWMQNVALRIGSGRIVNITPDSPSAGIRVGLLVPAPANCHSHSFQRAMAGLTEKRGPQGDDFWTWRRLMYRFLDRLDPDQIEAIAAFVQMEMLEAGYACNVEFHYLHHGLGGAPYDNLAETSGRIAAAAEATGCGLTLLPVHYEFGGCDRRSLGSGQIRFGNDFDRYVGLHDRAGALLAKLPEDTGLGVAPHSLRAVAADDLPRLRQLASGRPFHMHLAEQPAEVEEVLLSYNARPIEWVLERLDPGSDCTFIHCTQMQPHETKGLATTGAVAGLCPLTEASLGDGVFDGVRWMSLSGAVSVGSDSNIRISLAEELRQLDTSQRLRDHSRAAMATPDISTGRRLMQTAAEGGAQAAGRGSGRIEAGAWADLLALDTTHPDLEGLTGDTALDAFVFAGGNEMVGEVWSAGRHVVTGGRHKARDAIANAYRTAVRNLRDRI